MVKFSKNIALWARSLKIPGLLHSFMAVMAVLSCILAVRMPLILSLKASAEDPVSAQVSEKRRSVVLVSTSPHTQGALASIKPSIGHKENPLPEKNVSFGASELAQNYVVKNEVKKLLSKGALEEKVRTLRMLTKQGPGGDSAFASWDMPETIESVPLPTKSQYFGGGFLLLGSMFFVFLVFFSSLEMFWISAAWACVGISSCVIDPVFLTTYALIFFVPLGALSIYKAYAPKDLKNSRGLWLVMAPVFTTSAVVLSMLWGGLGELSGRLWMVQKMFWLPGALCCMVGSLLLWLGVCWGKFLGFGTEPKGHFSVISFHYWWLVICQMGALIFFNECGFLCVNLFLIGLLPFSYGGIVAILSKSFWRGPSPWLKALGGFFTTALGFPLIIVILSILLQPWTRRDHHGHC